MTSDCAPAGLPGASVTVTDGTTTYTGTSNGAGDFTTPTLTTGTWDYSATKARHVGTSGSVAIHCPQSSIARTLNLGIQSGYVCDAFTGSCLDPIAEVLFITDNALDLTVTLNYTTPGGGGLPYYYGVGTSASNAYPGVSTPCAGAIPATWGARTVTLSYKIGHTYTAEILCGCTRNLGGLPDGTPGPELGSTFAGYSALGSGSPTVTCPAPFTWTLTAPWHFTAMSDSPFNQTGVCDNNATVTLSVTE